MIAFGSVPAGAVLPIPFSSYATATGASITLTGLAITDVEIYRGTTVTQRSSDAGVVLLDTDGIDIDGVTGIHGFSVDTGDNTDAGFYAVGSFFYVVVSAVTIDGQTVNFLAATFRLTPAETVAGVSKVDVTHRLGVAEQPLISGTADSGSTTTLVDAARTEADTDYWVGQLLVITSGTLAGQARIITGFNAATDTITVSPAFTQAISTHTYEIWPASAVSSLDAAAVRAAIGLASANLDTQLTAIDDFVDALETRLTAALSAKLIAHAAAALVLVVDAGSSTTTVVFKTVEGTTPSATNDFYNGRVIVFTSGALAGQATSISDYVGASKTATVVAMTAAPADNDIAMIV